MKEHFDNEKDLNKIKNNLLRRIPKMDVLLADGKISEAVDLYGKKQVTEVIN